MDRPVGSVRGGPGNTDGVESRVHGAGQLHGFSPCILGTLPLPLTAGAPSPALLKNSIGRSWSVCLGVLIEMPVGSHGANDGGVCNFRESKRGTHLIR
jgi:hypothetical protein